MTSAERLDLLAAARTELAFAEAEQHRLAAEVNGIHGQISALPVPRASDGAGWAALDRKVQEARSTLETTLADLLDRAVAVDARVARARADVATLSLPAVTYPFATREDLCDE